VTATTLAQPPHAYPRRILLAVSGLSPQILTETLYALAVEQQPPYVPTEIYLITTSTGAKRAEESLLSDDLGWFARLRQDYALPAIAFTADHIEVPCDPDGEPMADIRTLEDNMRMADLITDRVRALTADPESALHVSIAGGRKTMGYYVGYALSLFGRPQDRLSHVLAEEAFESSSEFFYPTPYSHEVTNRNKKRIDTHEGRVILADIPFVRLRDGIPGRLQEGQATFAQTIDAAQRAQQSPELVIDLGSRRISVAGELVQLDPRELAFYSLMARRRLKDQPPVRWTTEGLAAQYLTEYGLILGEHHGGYARAEESLAKEMTKETFDEYKSRTNGTLEKALGATLAKPYQIQPTGKRPQTLFGLKLEGDAIRYGAVETSEPNV